MGDEQLNFRRATIADLSAIVALLADDPIGGTREIVASPVDPAYVEAFIAIDRDPNHVVLIVERAGRLIGCLQLSFVPGLTRRGMWRGQIEGVRIARSERGGGVGRALVRLALNECTWRGCGLVQLSTDKARPDALRFYQSLGFVASHEGMKLTID